uniref:Uncharacterized protein n=1 Tax=Ixodes ricinus TaxID=34613 RepID=A0A6B0UUF8_IXORI
MRRRTTSRADSSWLSLLFRVLCVPQPMHVGGIWTALSLQLFTLLCSQFPCQCHLVDVPEFGTAIHLEKWSLNLGIEAARDEPVSKSSVEEFTKVTSHGQLLEGNHKVCQAFAVLLVPPVEFRPLRYGRLGRREVALEYTCQF